MNAIFICISVTLHSCGPGHFSMFEMKKKLGHVCKNKMAFVPTMAQGAKQVG